MLIPRSAVDNKLETFAVELKELSFILNTFSELSTGHKDDLAIRTISSSGLLVYLTAHPTFAACLTVGVERLVALYKQLLEIKKLRSELLKNGVPEKQTSSIEEYANQLMEKGVEELSVEIVKKFYTGSDKGRKNELLKSMRISRNRIANRIDRGYNIEIRAAPADDKDAGPEDKPTAEQLQLIRDASRTMQFIKTEGNPILQLPEAAPEPKQKKE